MISSDSSNGGLTIRPLFSIVTAVFNGAATIEATIDSIGRQTFRDFEYIVVDGASTDQTVNILAKYSSAITTWKSEPDFGLYDALNKGLKLARGEWIAFIGADDVYYPDALEQYADAIRAPRNSGAQYASSRVELTRNDHVVRSIGRNWSWPAFLHHMTVAHAGSMHHRSLFQQYGGFDRSYKICGDYEFLLRSRNNLRSIFVDCVTVRMGTDGMSHVRLREALAEQARAKRITGGRATWRCALERRTAQLKAQCRRLLWY